MENNPVITLPQSESIKYFTPIIGDIRVGYECEFQIDKKNNLWRPFTFKKSDLFECAICNGEKVNQKDCELRTPYLTKEQIQAEGWEVYGKDAYAQAMLWSSWSFTKGNYMLLWWFRDKKINIIMKDVTLDEHTCNTSNGQIYLGDCPSINEFRYINKLLGI